MLWIEPRCVQWNVFYMDARCVRALGFFQIQIQTPLLFYVEAAWKRRADSKPQRCSQRRHRRRGASLATASASAAAAAGQSRAAHCGSHHRNGVTAHCAVYTPPTWVGVGVCVCVCFACFVYVLYANVCNCVYVAMYAHQLWAGFAEFVTSVREFYLT